MRFVLEGSRLEIPKDLPVPLQDLTAKCWAAQEENRPEASSVISSLESFINHQ